MELALIKEVKLCELVHNVVSRIMGMKKILKEPATNFEKERNEKYSRNFLKEKREKRKQARKKRICRMNFN